MITEAQEQKFLFQWAQLSRQKFPELEMLFHVPNGGKREKREAVALKKEGVKAGVPDLVFPVAKGGYFGLYIELKVGKNKPTENQLKWIEQLRIQNYFVVVCYGWREAADTIENYLGQPGTIVVKQEGEKCEI